MSTRHVAQLEIEEERAFYDNHYARSNVTAPIPLHFLPEADWQLWNQYVGPLTGKRVLECGAGDGKLAVWLAKQGASVLAVELSPVGVEKIKERAHYHGLSSQVKAYCGDCSRLEDIFDCESVDVALGWSVLHHLPPK